MIPNGDFENYSALPYDYGQWYFANDWSNVNGNQSGPPYGSPDYYHTAGTVGNYFAPIAPYSGNAQMGFATYFNVVLDYREYMETPLSCPMVPGSQYIVSFYIVSGVNGNYSYESNNIGLVFSTSPLTQQVAEPIPVQPQIEITSVVQNTSWVNYTYTFTADSAYQFLTIGNFRNDQSTTLSSTGSTGAYYFIDKIEVLNTQAGPLSILSDTVRSCNDQPYVLNVAVPNASYSWQDSSTDPTFTVLQSGTYWVNITYACGIVSDTFHVLSSDCTPALEMPNVFTPNSDGTNDLFIPVKAENLTETVMMIYNRWGQEIFETGNLDPGWDGTSNNEKCADGTYYWIIEYDDFSGTDYFSSGFVTLLH
jgi:gliding motility-associated-like protein